MDQAKVATSLTNLGFCPKTVSTMLSFKAKSTQDMVDFNLKECDWSATPPLPFSLYSNAPSKCRARILYLTHGPTAGPAAGPASGASGPSGRSGTPRGPRTRSSCRATWWTSVRAPPTGPSPPGPAHSSPRTTQPSTPSSRLGPPRGVGRVSQREPLYEPYSREK